jgi:hypothetical protein
VFTFGIGADASKSLVLGIAKYGHGKAEFIRSGERIEPVVMRQLKRALQPVLHDVNINWGSLPVAERYQSYSYIIITRIQKLLKARPDLTPQIFVFTTLLILLAHLFAYYDINNISRIMALLY